MDKIAIISHTDRGNELALTLQKEFSKSIIVTTRETNNPKIKQVDSTLDFVSKNFNIFEGFVFIGALGICVRSTAPHITDKQTDPAIVNIDDHSMYAQSVLSGHKGNANNLAKKIAEITGASGVLSTSSDLQNIWSLDLLHTKYNWSLKTNLPLNDVIALFVNNSPTAVLIETNDKGTEYLKKSLPNFATVYHNYEDIDLSKYKLLVAVSHKIYETSIPSIFYIPKVLFMGTGCSKELDNEIFEQELRTQLNKKGIHVEAIKEIGSASIKSEQAAYLNFSLTNQIAFKTFEADELASVTVPNPSKIVKEKVGTYSVSEASALLLSGNNELLVEKQKILLDDGEKFTFALALQPENKTKVAIVGAGPGDENLITIKGKELLEKADCVIYAGSLIPEQMTNWCKPGAIVRNSASLTLEEQIDLVKEHYQKGNAIVRLQCGDPSIYGAIQEQMTIMDELDIPYHIVPGISSFSAAAAALQSEFTIPEKVQTIILTRGEGKTPLPSSEKLEEMAKHKATMCIFLSAGIALKVQDQLLQHYSPDTPVAVLYRLTWEDEEIYRGTLQELAKLIKESKKKRTVLIVVGEAIGARENRSKLYNPEWKHIFRKEKQKLVDQS